MAAFHQPAHTPQGRLDPEDATTAQRLFEFLHADASRAIMGFACDEGVRRNKGRIGAKEGPAAIREALYGLSAPKRFAPFSDLGDIIVEDSALEKGQQLLATTISNALPKLQQLVVLGGGHETAYGSFVGLRHTCPDEKIGIINLDAHLDLRSIGEAGASSGTPFFQIQQHEGNNFDYLCLGVAQEANTQDLFDRAGGWGVSIIFDNDLSSADTAYPEIDTIVEQSDIIYLTIDLDVLPHYQAPGVSAPAVRGVQFTTIERIVKYIIAAVDKNPCRLPLVDLVEVSPRYDRDNMSAKSAALLALNFLR